MVCDVLFWMKTETWKRMSFKWIKMDLKRTWRQTTPFVGVYHCMFNAKFSGDFWHVNLGGANLKKIEGMHVSKPQHKH